MDPLALVGRLAWSPRLWFFLLLLAASTVALITVVWFERKAAARVQMRVGPYHASPRLGGYLQLFADAIKFLFSEPIVPSGASRALFVLGPPLFTTLALGAALLMPLTPGLKLLGGSVAYGFVFSLVLLLLVPLVVIVIGWAANNRFAYIGAAREALLVAAYELPVLLSFLSMALLYGTIDPMEMVERQAAVPGALMNLPAFLAFLTAAAIATARFPFEIADYENDVATGPYSDYGGVFLLLSFAGGTYFATFSYSLMASIVFLGGWGLPGVAYGPWPADMWTHLAGALWLLLKATILMFFFAFLRSVMPVLRLDHTLALGWRGLLALSAAGLAVSAAWLAARSLLGAP